MDFLGVNFWSVLSAAVAYILFGFLWYSDYAFGAAWRRLSGISGKEFKKMQKKGMGDTMVLAFLGALVTAYVVALMIGNLFLTDVWEIFALVEVLWLGFVVPTQLSPVLWEGKSWKLFVLNSAYYLMGLYVVGGVLALL